jgi:DNA-binding LacI/PurR family transcriptional regulator
MATIRDVARRAGVSPSTVSYAMSGKRSISAAARARIDAAITELDFTPSSLARQLAHSRSYRIGLVFPVSRSEISWEPLDFLPSASALLEEYGYSLTIFTGTPSPHDLLHLYRAGDVDGLIVMQVARHDPRIDILRDTGFPLALVGRPADPAGLCVVDYATDDACFLVFEHLVHLGHRRIGFLDLPESKHREELGYAWLIQQGFERARRELSFECVRAGTDGSYEDAALVAERMLRHNPNLTAFVTANGDGPIGVMHTLRRRGIAVPESVSVAGIAREKWFRALSPQLTAAEIPLIDMVRRAAELLLAQLADPDAPRERTVLFPAHLVVRGTTAGR